jgi:hypothetical protein
MSRNGGWDVRVFNGPNSSNYLDEFGNAAKDRESAHGINVNNQ